MFIMRDIILLSLFLVPYLQGKKDEKRRWKLIEVETGKLFKILKDFVKFVQRSSVKNFRYAQIMEACSSQITLNTSE